MYRAMRPGRWRRLTAQQDASKDQIPAVEASCEGVCHHAGCENYVPERVYRRYIRWMERYDSAVSDLNAAKTAEALEDARERAAAAAASLDAYRRQYPQLQGV